MKANHEIPQAITEAVTALLRPYVPGLTAAKLESAFCFVPDAEPVERLLTRRETAAELSVSLPTVDRLLRDGELPRRRIRGAVRVPKTAVESLKTGCTAK